MLTRAQRSAFYIEPDAIHIMKKSEYSGMYGDYLVQQRWTSSDAESEPDE